MALVKPAPEAQEHLATTGGGAINNQMAQAAIWLWYNSNTDRVILKISFLKIRVRDLRILFEILAGPEA
jgi:hypothetical protein